MPQHDSLNRPLINLLCTRPSKFGSLKYGSQQRFPHHGQGSPGGGGWSPLPRRVSSALVRSGNSGGQSPSWSKHPWGQRTQSRRAEWAGTQAALGDGQEHVLVIGRGCGRSRGEPGNPMWECRRARVASEFRYGMQIRPKNQVKVPFTCLPSVVCFHFTFTGTGFLSLCVELRKSTSKKHPTYIFE